MYRELYGYINMGLNLASRKFQKKKKKKKKNLASRMGSTQGFA